MAKKVVDHFGGTQTHTETWVELQQINGWDMEEVRCGVLDFNELHLYLGVQACSVSN